VLVEKVTVKQLPISRNEFFKSDGRPTLAMDSDEVYPSKRERLVVLVRSSVLCGDVTDGRGHCLLRDRQRVPTEVPPRELQMLPVAELARLTDNSF
jgi:hypothetical protein